MLYRNFIKDDGTMHILANPPNEFCTGSNHQVVWNTWLGNLIWPPKQQLPDSTDTMQLLVSFYGALNRWHHMSFIIYCI